MACGFAGSGPSLHSPGSGEVEFFEEQSLKEEVAGSAPFAIKLTKRSLSLALDVQGFRNSLMAHFDTHQLAY